MALYGLYFKEKSERVYKSDSFIPDEPTDKVEATSPVAARLNFVRKLKIPFKTFQTKYSVRKIASLDSLDINQQEELLFQAAVEESTVVPPYEDRSKVKFEEALERNAGPASQRVKNNLPLNYRPAITKQGASDPTDVYQCKGCVQYQAGKCRLFQAVVNPVYVCNSFGKAIAKRVPVDKTIVEIAPQPVSSISPDDSLEEKRRSNRSITAKKFRTEADSRKRATEKQEAVSSERKYGPKKRITPPVFNVKPNTDIELDKTNDIETPSQVGIAEEATISRSTSSGGGPSY